jgi:hypothetical protein
VGRAATIRKSLPSGSPNTTIPATIEDMFAATEVTAITPTPSPTCRLRAEAKKAGRLRPTRGKGSYLQAQYQRLRPRLGHGRALAAVKHSMFVAYHLRCEDRRGVVRRET